MQLGTIESGVAELSVSYTQGASNRREYWSPGLDLTQRNPVSVKILADPRPASTARHQRINNERNFGVGMRIAQIRQEDDFEGYAVNSVSQADTPRLTLVSSAAQPAHQPAEAVDPVNFLQSMTVSLELDEVLDTLNQFLFDLVGHSGWEYHHEGFDCHLSGGTADRHRIEYALTLNEQEMGTLKLMRGRRFSDNDQMRIESLLGLAAQSLRNALRFFTTSQQLERDPLTGLGNRRALMVQGAQWIADSVRHHHPITLLVMDLDRFKSVNDTHGHPVGDQLLCGVAETLRSVTRAADLCVRMGGDEFVVLLPQTDLSAALECAERIRQSIARKFVVTPAGQGVSASVSIGVSALRHGMDLDQLYHQADDALYAAKRAGSNRVLAGAGNPGLHVQ